MMYATRKKEAMTMAGNGQGYHYTLIKHGGGDIRSGTTSDNRWHNVGEGEKFPRTLGTCLELPYTIGQLMLLPLGVSRTLNCPRQPSVASRSDDFSLPD